MERIKDGVLIFGLNLHTSSLEMTLLGMLVLGMVERTPVLSVVLVVRYYTKCLNIHNSVEISIRL